LNNDGVWDLARELAAKSVRAIWFSFGIDPDGVAERSREAEDLSGSGPERPQEAAVASRAGSDGAVELPRGAGVWYFTGPRGVLKRPRIGVPSRAGTEGPPRRPWMFLMRFFMSSVDIASRLSSSKSSLAMPCFSVQK
jgi:hypothetical protein